MQESNQNSALTQAKQSEALLAQSEYYKLLEEYKIELNTEGEGSQESLKEIWLKMKLEEQRMMNLLKTKE